MARRAALKKNCRSLWRSVIKLSRAIFFCFHAKTYKSCNFLMFWPIMLKNCIFKLPRSRASQQRMTCPSEAKKSCGTHLFRVGPGKADQTAFMPKLSKAITLFILCPILVKFHIRTWLIESFPSNYRFWRCAEEKLDFTPVHTLRQLKRDEALFPPFWRVVEFRGRYG